MKLLPVFPHLDAIDHAKIALEMLKKISGHRPENLIDMRNT